MHTTKTRLVSVVVATLVGTLVGAALRIGRLGLDAYRVSLTPETIVLDVVQAAVVAVFVTWTLTRSKKGLTNESTRV